MSRKTSYRHNRRLMAAAIAACFATAPAWSLPVAPTVVNGTATFNQAGNVLSVTNSNNAIINWQKFGISAGEVTKFIQSSASSSVLNRVVGGELSAIYGSLQSNGRVWLVNPAGILVGPGGSVNTAAFLASTLGVRNEDFLAGKLTFSGAGGNVVNQGTITTPTGGSVYLIGANVSNEGVITSPKGDVILAAGQTVSLVDTATPGVKVEITGAEGNTTNLGTIAAEAGRIGMAGVIVRNSGTLNASSAVEEGGRVFLRASQDTYVDGSGRIVATGTKGGRVEVLGNRVAVMDSASIDASGTNGGGTVLVGGDFQGKNPGVQNSQITFFGPNASIKANATDNGDGGKVIVWADDTTRAYGNIQARGGENGGNGGFVEVSGKRFLDFSASVDTSAPKGKTGTLLLDPSDIEIGGAPDDYVSYGGYFGPIGGYYGFSNATSPPVSHISWDAINVQLGSNNIAITTTGSGGNGDITILSDYHYDRSTNLSLLANRHINTNGHDVSNYPGSGSIVLVAGWDDTAPNPIGNPVTSGTTGSITGNGSFTTAGGDFTAKAAGSIALGTIDTIGWGGIHNDGGAINLAAGSSITTGDLLSGGAIDWGNNGGNGGAITLTAGTSITTGTVDSQGARGGSYSVGGTGGAVIMTAAGTTITTGTIVSRGGDGGEGASGGGAGNITLTAVGLVAITGDVIATGGDGGKYHNDGSVVGLGYGLGGDGGDGGTISISGSAVTVSSGRLIDASGGAGGFGDNGYGYDGGNGGLAGNITLTATAGNIDLSAGGIIIIRANGGAGGYSAGGSGYGDIYAGNGRTGGSIVLSSFGGITMVGGEITANGGRGGNNGYGYAGYAGGGGSITLGANGTISLTSSQLNADGGAGGHAFGYGYGESGGSGGTIALYSNSVGNIVLTGTTLNANGGVGGDSTNYGYSGGGGGYAGRVVLETANGSITLTNSRINAYGGIGGTGAMNDPTNGYYAQAGGTGGGGYYVHLTAGGATADILLTGTAIDVRGGQGGIGGAATLTGWGIGLGGDGGAGGAGGDVLLSAGRDVMLTNSTILAGGGAGGLGGYGAGTSGATGVSDSGGYVGVSAGRNAGIDRIDLANGQFYAGQQPIGGYVYINAGGTILDQNAVGANNITASKVTLYSAGGTPGGLAISMDTAADEYIEAMVTGGSSGGIRLANTSALQPSDGVTLSDGASGSNSASFTQNFTAGGTLTTDSLWLETTAGGRIDVASNGNLTWNGGSGYITPHNGTVNVLAAGTLAIDSPYAGGGDSLNFDGGILNINADVSGLGVALNGSAVTIASGATVAGTVDVGVVAGVLQHYGTLQAGHDIVIAAGPASIVGGTIDAGNSVSLGATALSMGSGTIQAGNSVGITIAGSANLADSYVTADYGNIDIAVGGNLDLVNSYIGAGIWIAEPYSGAGGDMNLATSRLTMTDSGIFAWNQLALKANDVTMDHSSIDTWYGDIKGRITYDLSLTEGIISAGNDIFLQFVMPSSSIYLNGTASYPAVIESNWYTGVGQTTYIDFLSRTSGGIWIDGTETATTVEGGSGFYHYVGSSWLPALQGNGLFITYAMTQDICTTMPDLCRPPVTATTLIDPCAFDPKLCTPPPLTDFGRNLDPNDQGIGGAAGEFGDDGKDTKEGRRRVRMCRG